MIYRFGGNDISFVFGGFSVASAVAASGCNGSQKRRGAADTDLPVSLSKGNTIGWQEWDSLRMVDG